VIDLNASFTQSFPPIAESAWHVSIGAGTGIVSFLTNGPNETSWYVAPPNVMFTPTSLPQVKYGALAAPGDRAFAVLVTSEGMPWWMRSAEGMELVKGLIADPMFPASVIAAEDHFIVAGTNTNAIVLYRFDHASGATASSPSTKVTLPSTMGSTILGAFQAEPLSMAASRGRVLVTWINDKGNLSPGNPLGGYALLKCASK